MKKQTSEEKYSFSAKGSMNWSEGGDYIQFASEEDVAKFQVFLKKLEKDHEDEKKKWKEEVMEMIGEDEDVKENKNNWLVPEYEIPIVNQFHQELRVKLNKI